MRLSVRLSSLSGLSILELTIALAIVGTFAAFGIPKFRKYQAMGEQAEAKISLARIYDLEQAYQKAHGAYGSDLDLIGFRPLENARYKYSVALATGAAFSVLAEARTDDIISSGCRSKDTWMIDQSKQLVAVNDCSKK